MTVKFGVQNRFGVKTVKVAFDSYVSCVIEFNGAATSKLARTQTARTRTLHFNTFEITLEFSQGDMHAAAKYAYTYMLIIAFCP